VLDRVQGAWYNSVSPTREPSNDLPSNNRRMGRVHECTRTLERKMGQEVEGLTLPFRVPLGRGMTMFVSPEISEKGAGVLG
jgi:hypothetical protein